MSPPTRRRRISVTKSAKTGVERLAIKIMDIATRRIGRLLRGMVLLKWEPIPLFGVGLTMMLLYWIALAFFR